MKKVPYDDVLWEDIQYYNMRWYTIYNLTVLYNLMLYNDVPFDDSCIQLQFSYHTLVYLCVCVYYVLQVASNTERQREQLSFQWHCER